MQVHALMSKAGATSDEIEEMMALLLNRAGCTSEEFIDNVKQAMEKGGESNNT